MATLSGRVKVSGLSSYISCSYTCTHGVSPGVISIVVPAADLTPIDLTEAQDIQFTDGERQFTLKGCRSQASNLIREANGYAYQVTLHDRRWQWATMGQVSGEFNVRDQGGKIIPSSRTKVKELAELCLKAMKEQEGSWDITALPNPAEDDALPAINWEYANPAQSLAALADQFGCRVVYQPIQDRVLIAKPGDGKDMPEGSFADPAPAKEVPPRPGILRFVGAPASFVMPIVLEAVGEELNGKVIPLNDLSYKPKDGWGQSGDNVYGNLVLQPKFGAKGKTLKDCKNAANKSVFKWFRVTTWPAKEDEFTVPGLDQFSASNDGPVDIIADEQIIPLDRLIGTLRDEEKHLWIDPPKVYAIYADGAGGNTTDKTPVSTPFTIDPERRLVMFDRRLFRINLAEALLKAVFNVPIASKIYDVLQFQSGPAELILLTSIHVRDPYTRQPVRYTRDRKIKGGRDGLVQVVRRDDVQFAQWAEFKPGEWTAKNLRDNREEIDKAADHYLNAFELFDPITTDSRRYPRLVLIDPDGAIQAVTWECSGKVTTVVSRNNERVRWLSPYIYRRGQERGKVMIDAANLIRSIAVRTANVPVG